MPSTVVMAFSTPTPVDDGIAVAMDANLNADPELPEGHEE